MLGLWTGSAESVAIKMSFFMGFLSFSLCIISVAIPFFLLRKSSSTLGTVLGYILGFAVTFAGLVASVVYLELIEHVPPPISSGGPFRNFPVALIGPAVGIWAAKRARGQQPK